MPPNPKKEHTQVHPISSHCPRAETRANLAFASAITEAAKNLPPSCPTLQRTQDHPALHRQRWTGTPETSYVWDPKGEIYVDPKGELYVDPKGELRVEPQEELPGGIEQGEGGWGGGVWADIGRTWMLSSSWR